MKNGEFAAFIMTYERPEILLRTIQILQEQTFPPSFLYIVDNSESNLTEKAVRELNGENIEYFRVGYNSGPAGAAAIGLQKLESRGYKWIYWGDDDNPPFHNSVFEKQFEELRRMGSGAEEVGIIGGKGGCLNKWTGRIETFSNEELRRQNFLEVDFIPGGGSMLINASVVKENVLPEPKLFFGFEEFDFCLRVKKKGYKLLVNTGIWLEENFKEGFKDRNFKWKASNFGKRELLWRDYYSGRNLLHIYYKNRYYAAFSFLLLKRILKSFAGVKYGWSYGIENFKIQWLALLHFFTGVYGK